MLNDLNTFDFWPNMCRFWWTYQWGSRVKYQSRENSKKGVEYHKAGWVKISIKGQWRYKEGSLTVKVPKNGPSEKNAVEGSEWKYEEEVRVKKRVSTASSQVAAASLDLFAPSRLPTMLPNISALHTSVCGYVSSLRAIHDFHHSRRRILWKDQRWSHGRKHNCKSWGGMQQVFRCHFVSRALGCTREGRWGGRQDTRGTREDTKIEISAQTLVCPSKFWQAADCGLHGSLILIQPSSVFALCKCK